MLITKIEREKQALLEESREEGREEGLEEGRMKERREIVQSMHGLGFDLATISDVIGLSQEQVQLLLESKTDDSQD